ncbi:MAG: metallophosphoesterase [Candidatus Eisenbacteria bacterium]
MRKGPYLIYPGTNTEMQVLWQLTAAETCSLEWGTDLTYSLGSAETAEYGGDHQHAYTIPGLSPGALYYYRVSVAAEEYTGSFRAAPSTDASQVKFIAYGDTRSYPADHDGVAASMISEYLADPAFQTMLISVGDLINNGNLEADWDNQFFDPAYTNIQTMLATMPYQSCMGNHEGTGVLFTKYFPYPFVSGRYWSFDYGPAHFVCVDQYTSYSSGSPQLTWIENDLAASTKLWNFIYLHEPGWTSGHHENNTTVQTYIQPLCEQYGVPIVFGGHNHYYSRGLVNGVHHITTGGGGAPPYSPTPGQPYIVYAISAYHYCMVEIDGYSLDFTARTRSGTVIDTFSVDLPQAAVGYEDPDVPPQALSLSPAGPNPFARSTVLSFSVPEAAHVDLGIYAVGGRRIRTLVDGMQGAGYHSTEWDGRDESGNDVSSGIYFCRLQTKDAWLTRKLILAE